MVSRIVDGVLANQPPQEAVSDDATTAKRGATGIAIGADHGGYDLKSRLADHLRKQGHEVQDVGTDSKDAVDYPVFARAVADMAIIIEGGTQKFTGTLAELNAKLLLPLGIGLGLADWKGGENHSRQQSQ